MHKLFSYFWAPSSVVPSPVKLQVAPPKERIYDVYPSEKVEESEHHLQIGVVLKHNNNVILIHRPSFHDRE